MTVREKFQDSLFLSRQPGYQPENESDFMIKAGLKLSHPRLILAISDSGQVSAAALGETPA